MLASLAAGVRNLRWWLQPFGWIVYLAFALVYWFVRLVALLLELVVAVVWFIFNGLRRFLGFLVTGSFLEVTIKVAIALFVIGYLLTNFGLDDLGPAVMNASAIPIILFGLGMIVRAAR